MIPFINAFGGSDCTFTVTLTEPESNLSAQGISVGICPVAVKNNGEYSLHSSFSSASITLDMIEADPVESAEKLFEHVKSNHVQALTAVTDEKGEARFETDSGLFLVYCESGGVTFAPYLIELPLEAQGQTLYAVSSRPKTDHPSVPEVVTSVKVTKIWDDLVDKYAKRPEFVTVTLLRDSTPFKRATLSEANGWKHTFEGLNAKYSYTVSEQEVEDYSASYSGNATDGYVIVNKYIGEDAPIVPAPEYASVTVTKLWNDEDNKNSCRPESIAVQLIADGEVVSTASLKKANGWRYTFTRLDRNVQYTVKEITPSGYSAEYKGNATDGFVITNTYTETTDPGNIPVPGYPDDPVKTDIFVKVVWEDDDNLHQKRPGSVTVHLISNGVIIQSGTVTPDTDWEYTFGNVEVNGAYTVFEVAVDGYTTEYSGNAADGFIITNIYTEETDPGTPPDPTVPDIPGDTPSDTPTKPDQPQIPQTGHVTTPLYALMLIGAAIVLTGLFFVLKGNKGILLILTGFLLVGISTATFIFYDREDAKAGEKAAILLREVKAAIPPPSLVGEVASDDSESGELPQKHHLGYSVGGVLSIPSLNLELPIQSDWDYSLLKTSPCRYSGSAEEGNLILLGHNYNYHFGRLKNCYEGDSVFFTDVNGTVYSYTVAALEVLDAYALDQLTTTDYDLTVFTCTNSGTSRYVLRCNLNQNA